MGGLTNLSEPTPQEQLMTTLEAATEYGQLKRRGVERFLEENGLTFEEATADLGDNVLDAYELAKSLSPDR